MELIPATVKAPYESKGPRPVYKPRNRAQEAAIEKSLSRYLRMACGCATTLQDNDVVSALRPLGRMQYWCPGHDEWQDLAPKKEKAVLPDTPLF